MLGRLGAFYHLQHAYSPKSAGEAANNPRRTAATTRQPEEIGMFLRLGGVVVVVLLAVFVMSWVAN